MSGTFSHESKTTIGNYESTTTGQGSTDLAQAVAPPAEQETYWGAMIILGILAAIFFSNGDTLIGMVLGLFAYGSFNVSNEAEEYNKKIYPKEYEKWLHSYICYRCGNRFVIR